MTATRHLVRPGLICTVLACLGLLSASAAQGAGTVNGVIAYTAGGDIYTVNPEGANHTRLTKTPQLDVEPEYSPDGTKVAFVRFPSLRLDDLFVVNSNGSATKRLTSFEKPISSPVWSSDGSRIIYLTERDNDFDGVEIYSIFPDGTGETLLATDAISLSSFSSSFASAGNRIVYVNSSGEIAVMGLDGSGTAVIADAPGDVINRYPQISPDASHVAFESSGGPGDGIEVFTVAVDGSGLTQITDDGGSAPIYSPDGQHIAFTGSFGYQGAVVINPDGSGLVKVSRSRRNFAAAEFSPDSTRLALSETLPKGGEDPFFRLFSTPIDRSKPLSLTAPRDLAEYGDWQAVSAVAPNPNLTLTAKSVRSKRGKPPLAEVTCANECDIVLTASGRIGGTRFSSRTEAELFGAVPTGVPALGGKTLEALRGKRGTVEVTVKATDDFGQKAKATVRVALG